MAGREGGTRRRALLGKARRTFGDAHVSSASLITADIFTEEPGCGMPARFSCRLTPATRSRTRLCSIFKAGCFVVTACFLNCIWFRSRVFQLGALGPRLYANIRLVASNRLITTNPVWFRQYFTSLKKRQCNKATAYYYYSTFQC